MNVPRIFQQVLWSLVLILTASTAQAETPLRFDRAWIREPAPGQQVAAVYGRLYLPADATLIAVSSPGAASAAVHTTSTHNGQTRMRDSGPLKALPETSPIILAPGATHIMLMGLNQALKAGDTVDIELKLKVSSFTSPTPRIVRYVFKVPVRPLNASAL